MLFDSHNTATLTLAKDSNAETKRALALVEKLDSRNEALIQTAATLASELEKTAVENKVLKTQLRDLDLRFLKECGVDTEEQV
jgi:hypothetical protein